jgi:sugar lactone lactonase YvrE
LRRHGKASSAGSIEGNGNDRGLFRRAFATRDASSEANGSGARSLGLAVLLVGLFTVLLGASVAQAYNSFVPSGNFRDTNFNEPGRLAVDENTGNVLVINPAASAVEVYDDAGPDATLLTSFGGSDLSGISGIAIDQSDGDVYVTDVGHKRIVRYETLGGPTPTYTLDSGYSTPAASSTPGSGAPAGTVGSFASALAVDPTNGDLLVADRGNNRVSRFDDTGAFVSDFDGADSTDGAFTHLEDVVLSPAGLIFVSDSTAPDAANGGLSRVLRFSNAGAYQATLRAPSGAGDAYLAYDAVHANLIVADARLIPFYEGFNPAFHVLDPVSGASNVDISVPSAERLTGLAFDPGTGRLYVGRANPNPINNSSVRVFDSQTRPGLVLDAPSAITQTSVHLSGSVHPDGLPTTYNFELSKDGGATWTTKTPPTSAGAGGAPVTVQADFTVEPNTAYLARLVASNAQVTDAASAPRPFTTAVSAPATETRAATTLTTSSATLRGLVNPFGQQTGYHFEYGIDTNYGSRIPVAGEAVLGNGHSTVPVAQSISGLQPGTTYHFRLVATNSTGAALGEDLTFATPASDASKRTYELVSPADKGGYNVFREILMKASPDGNAFSFTSAYSNLANQGNEAAPYLPRYVARRTADGWITKSTDPPQGDTTNFIRRLHVTSAVSLDGSKALVGSTKALAPGAIPGGSNLYLRDVMSGGLTLVAAIPDPYLWFGATDLPLLAKPYGGGTESFDHLLIYAREWSLLPGVPPGALYDFTDGQLHLVSVDPDGNPVPGVGAAWDDREKIRVTPDGSKIFFLSHPGFSVESQTEGGEGPAYVRIDGERTQVMSESHRAADAGTIRPAKFAGASRDGSVAYIFSKELTEDSKAGITYLYRYTVATEDLEALTPVAKPGELYIPRQVSADGSTVYFETVSELTPGASGYSFYVWRDGSLSRVASLENNDVELVIRFPSWMSPSGRYFAFESASNLTGYDTGSCIDFRAVASPPPRCVQVYRYDADLKQLTCASCPPSGELPRGGANLGVGGDEVAGENYPRAVNDAGQVFFDTVEQLIPADTNAVEDVYEYDGSEVRLISPGHGEKSQLAGVSRDGRDVFFTTTARLVKADVDGANDVYDARIGGGIASQNAEAPSAACFGEDCRGLPPVPPAPPPGGSETTFGPGTQSARKKARCAKGRKLREVKGKQRCVKSVKKGKANQSRRQGR